MAPPYLEIVAPRLLIGLSRVAPIHIQYITLWPLIVGREPMAPEVRRHEVIHVCQQFECGVLTWPIWLALSLLHPAFILGIPLSLPVGWPLFVPLYYGSYLYAMLRHRGDWETRGETLAARWGWIDRPPAVTLGELAYLSIPFEQEAYACERDLDYLARRQWFAWVKYRV